MLPRPPPPSRVLRPSGPSIGKRPSGHARHTSWSGGGSGSTTASAGGAGHTRAASREVPCAAPDEQVDVGLDQIGNRALVGGALFALATASRGAEKKPVASFNQRVGAALQGLPAAGAGGGEQSDNEDGIGPGAPRTAVPLTRARSSSSPSLYDVAAGQDGTGSGESAMHSPSVTFDVPISAPPATPQQQQQQQTRRRAASTATTTLADTLTGAQAEHVRRRRSASSLSMQTRQGFLAFSILEEGEEDVGGVAAASMTGDSVVPAAYETIHVRVPISRSDASANAAVARERSRSHSSGGDALGLGPYCEEEEGDDADFKPTNMSRNRAISVVGHETTLGRFPGVATSSNKTDAVMHARPPLVRGLSRPSSLASLSTASISSSSRIGTHTSGIISSPIDDDDSPHERQMRAWLQGQLAEPPPLPGTNAASAGTQTSAAASGARSHSPSHSRSSSYGGARARSASLSAAVVRGAEQLVGDSIGELGTIDGDTTLTSASRLELIALKDAVNEELLGLESLARADEDIWIVYGALSEEYLRLKSWTGGLQGSIGELAASW